jgi:hypothetical protein
MIRRATHTLAVATLATLTVGCNDDPRESESCEAIPEANLTWRECERDQCAALPACAELLADTTPPDFTLTSPLTYVLTHYEDDPVGTPRNARIVVGGTIDDPSGAAELQYSIEGFDNRIIYVGAGVRNPPNAYIETPVVYAAGEYDLTVSAYDRAGNKTQVTYTVEVFDR